MFMASHEGHAKVVDLLVQAGADIHLVTKVHVSTHTVSSLVAVVVETNIRLINPWCAYAGRVKVLGLSSVSVSFSSFSLLWCGQWKWRS